MRANDSDLEEDVANRLSSPPLDFVSAASGCPPTALSSSRLSQSHNVITSPSSPLLAASLLHPPSPFTFGSPSLATDFTTVLLLALSASLRHFLAHHPLPSVLLPLSLFHPPLRLHSAPPLLALRTLHALSVLPFGCAEALLPLAPQLSTRIPLLSPRSSFGTL